MNACNFSKGKTNNKIVKKTALLHNKYIYVQ